MTSVNKRPHEIGSVPKFAIENFYYNWHCGMCMGFNGTPYPSDYPRETYDVGSLTLNGKHMSFSCLDKYCKERNIKHG